MKPGFGIRDSEERMLGNLAFSDSRIPNPECRNSDG
jgi:hypothetical protein